MKGVLIKDGQSWYVTFKELDNASFINIVDDIPIPTIKPLEVHLDDYNHDWLEDGIVVQYQYYVIGNLRYAKKLKLVEKPIKLMKFELNLNEQLSFNKFQEEIKENHGEYGIFTFSFTHTGIGLDIEVYSKLAKKKKNITDFDSW